jgi:DNA-directed RNA polymerase subunit RPC12/RpoP
MNNYPKAAPPDQEKQGEIIKRCLHCGKDVSLKKWDSWNGFLVECPHCHGLHGKRWNIRRVLLASFVFNAFSFLFTMRPRNAVLSLVGFIVVAIIGNYFLDRFPDLFQIVIVIVFVFSPMLINAVILMKHERDLDDSAPPKQALGT